MLSYHSIVEVIKDLEDIKSQITDLAREIADLKNQRKEKVFTEQLRSELTAEILALTSKEAALTSKEAALINMEVELMKARPGMAIF